MPNPSTTLIPAYGRDYKSKAQILADLEAQKDFIIADISNPWDGKPANKRDLLAFGVTTIYVRYKRLANVAKIKLS